MFERFSDRARKVMALANMEAQRFNHEYIGTEHLLLGLVKEGCGVGATALKKQGVDLAALRREVEKLVQSGPNMIATGKLPQTPRAKRVVEYAIEEARAFDDNYIGTEHLLLGLFRETEGVAARILTKLGLTVEDTRRTIADLRGTGVPHEPPPALGMGATGHSEEMDYLRSLTAYQPADELAHMVYKVTEGFPSEEIYGVASHLRRAALRLPPNIAAAYRRSSNAEARWFVNIALGLFRELQYGLDFSVKLGYLKSKEYDELVNLLEEIDEDLTEFHAALARPRDS